MTPYRYFGIFVASLGLLSCSSMYQHCGNDGDCNTEIGERCLGRDGSTGNKICTLPERECDPKSWRPCPATCQTGESGPLIEECLDSGRWSGCFGDAARLSCPVGFLLYHFDDLRISEKVGLVADGKRADYTCVAMHEAEVLQAMAERQDEVVSGALEPFEGVCLDKERKSFSVLNVHCCAALDTYVTANESSNAIKSIDVAKVLKQCADVHSQRKELNAVSYNDSKSCFAYKTEPALELPEVASYIDISQDKLDVRLSQAQFFSCVASLQKGQDAVFGGDSDEAHMEYNGGVVYTYKKVDTKCNGAQSSVDSLAIVAYTTPKIPELRCSDFLEATTLRLLNFTSLGDADAQRDRVECDSLNQCESRDNYLQASHLALLTKNVALNAASSVNVGAVIKCDPLATDILKDLDVCQQLHRDITENKFVDKWGDLTAYPCYKTLPKLVDGFYEYCPISDNYSDGYALGTCTSYLKSSIENYLFACSVYGLSCINRPSNHCLKRVLGTGDNVDTIDKDFGTDCYFEKFDLSAVKDSGAEASLRTDLWAYLSSCPVPSRAGSKVRYKWTDATKVSASQRCFQANSECDILENPSTEDASTDAGGEKKGQALYTRCASKAENYLMCTNLDNKIAFTCEDLAPVVSTDPRECDGEDISVVAETGIDLSESGILELDTLNFANVRSFDAKPYQTANAKGYIIALAYELSSEAYGKVPQNVKFLIPNADLSVSFPFPPGLEKYHSGYTYLLVTKFDENDALSVVSSLKLSHKADPPKLYIGSIGLAEKQEKFLEINSPKDYMPRQPKLNVIVTDEKVAFDVFYIADRPLKADKDQYFIRTDPKTIVEAEFQDPSKPNPTIFSAYLTASNPTLYVQSFEVTETEISAKTTAPIALEAVFEGDSTGCDLSLMVCPQSPMPYLFVPECLGFARSKCANRYLDDVYDFDLVGSGLNARINAMRGLGGIEHMQSTFYDISKESYTLKTESRSYDKNGNYKSAGKCLVTTETAVPLQTGTTWSFMKEQYLLGFIGRGNSTSSLATTLIAFKEGIAIVGGTICKWGEGTSASPLATWRNSEQGEYVPAKSTPPRSVFATDYRFLRATASGEVCARWITAWIGKEKAEATESVYLSSMMACPSASKVEGVALQGEISTKLDLPKASDVEALTVTVLAPSRALGASRVLLHSQVKLATAPRETTFALYELSSNAAILEWKSKPMSSDSDPKILGFSKWFGRDGLVLSGDKLDYLKLKCAGAAQ